MVAWAAIIPAIGAAAKAAGSTDVKVGTAAAKAGATAAKTTGKSVATGAKKVGEVAKTGKDKLVDMLQSPTEPQPTPMPTPDDTTKTPDEIETNKRRKAFMNALNSGAQQLAKQQTSNNYEFTPSRVDYSQFMGLSPETQRYLYGRL